MIRVMRTESRCNEPQRLENEPQHLESPRPGPVARLAALLGRGAPCGACVTGRAKLSRARGARRRERRASRSGRSALPTASCRGGKAATRASPFQSTRRPAFRPAVPGGLKGRAALGGAPTTQAREQRERAQRVAAPRAPRGLSRSLPRVSRRHHEPTHTHPLSTDSLRDNGRGT